MAIFCLGALAQSPCTITQLPYACRLDTVPECWSGDNPQHIYGTSTSPEIDPSIPISQLTLRLKLHTMPSANWTVALYVGFKDSVGGAFIPYDTLFCNSHSFDREYEVSFAQYAGTGRHLCFQVEYFQSIFMGDLLLDYTPTCGNPLIVQMDSVSGTWASLSWQPRQGESSWQYAYNYTGDGPVQWMQTSTPHVLLQGLDPVTEYGFFLQAECSPVDAGPMPVFPVRMFSTICPEALDLPFTDDFSNTLLEDCWTNMWFNANETGSINGDYAAMPPVPDGTDVSSLMVTLRYRASGSNLTVGVMDDPDDTATFVPVATVSPELSNTWYYHEVIFDGYTGSGKYVAFKDGGIYLDDVTLMETPPCVYPFPVTTEHITGTTADVVFTPRGTESQWEVACGPAGFNPNMGGMHQTVGYSTPSLSGLTPLTTYDVYVRSICGGTPGPWSVRHTFTTQCPPITQLPYTENFDTYGTDADTCYPGCWLRYSSWSNLLPHVVNMQAIDISYAFSLPGALELKGSDSNGWYLAVMPELDPDIDLQGLQVSCSLAYDPLFWTNGVLEVGVMDNPYDPSTFTPVLTSNSPHGAVARFFHYTGTGRHIAFRNTGTTDIYIDDVVLDVAPPCGDPVNLAVADILGTSALVSWEPIEYGTEADYIVFYRQSGDAVWDSVTVTGHQTFLSGLAPEAEYEVRVRCNCVEGPGDYAYASFRTRCEDIGSAQVGNGWWEQGLVPLGASRTYSQQLFTESELSLAEVPTDIGAIELQYRILYPNANSDHRHQLELYLGTTQQEAFSSPTSWVPFSTLQQVFADTVQLHPDDSAQWVTIQFQVPFHYGGSGSLVLAAVSNSIDDEGIWFLSERTAENRSIYDYRDEYEPPFAPGSDVLQGIYDERYRSNIRFVSCDSTASCPTPNLSVSASGSDAYLDIVPGGTESSWEIEYRKYEDAVWTSYGTVTTATPVVTGLEFSKDYLVRVRAVCSPSGHSAWRTALFSTECGTIEHLPFTEDFNAYAGFMTYLIPNCWSRMPYSQNQLPEVGQDGNLLLYKGLVALPPLSDTIDPSGLMLTFKAFRQAGPCEIGIMEDPADLSTFLLDTVMHFTANLEEYEIPLTALAGRVSSERYIAFHFADPNNTYSSVAIDDLVLDYIPSCWHPKDVTLDTAYGTTAVVSWTERSSASQWDVEYGPHGFTPGTGTGTIVTVYGNPATLTNLPGNSYLDFYVRADCGGGDVSQWSHTCCSCSTAPCDSADMCDMKVVLIDERPVSQGWYYYKLKMFVDGVFQRDLYLETTEPDTLYLPVCDNTQVAFLVDGTGIMEVTVSLYAPNGDILAENLSGNSSWDAVNQVFDTLYSFYNDCDVPSCVAPMHLTLDSVGAHEVLLDWEPLGSASSWLVEYRSEADSTWSSVVANTHPFVLNSLAAQTSYYVRVRAVCDDGGVSEFRSTEHFNTSCDGVMAHIVGRPEYDGGMPDNNPKYSYSQQIYTADELQGVEDISSFQLLNTRYYSYYVWDIYLGHTTKDTFQDMDDFIDPQSLSLVYSGTINDYDQTPEHWVTFSLDSTFHYNGSDNLVLAVYNHVGENRLPNNRWKAYTTYIDYQHRNYQAFYASYYMNTPFELTTSSLMNITHNVATYKNYIIFPKCCATPYGVFVQPNATDTTATVTWQPGGGESRWVLEYKTVSASEWTSVVCQQPSYLIADVIPSVQYMGRVMAVCDTASGEGSGFVDFTFTVVPAAPEAYSIVSSAGPGGTILPTGNINVMSGYDITFDIVADTAAGYVIQDVLVDEVSQGPVPTYTFYAVDADHTIRAEFQNVGIDDFPEESLVLYPNPTNGKLTVSGSKFQVSSIEIYDVYGKLLQSVTVNDVAADLDVSVLPAGLYFARIRTGNGVVTKRFVKR